ncbi:hypothetical protein ACFQ80_07020 [Isoptericola sp. NPDC056578]|uniref:8-oxoguanine DNA glycosylase OGG fold protein n=1 Tax=Isoptericola sp. NPDC056578 TaxID=3345870 RepID=UPI0036B10326
MAATDMPYEHLLRPLETVPPLPHDLAQALGDGAVRPQGQEGMKWNRERWASRLRGVPDVGPFLDQVPSTVDRAATNRLVLDTYDDGRDDLAFVAAMIWGYGPSGYGPYRTSRVLSGDGQAAPDPEVRGKLRDGAAAARRDGALAGFYALNNRPGRIRFLGPAFFTKWLYFTTATGGPDDRDAAPILDLRVQRWIARQTGLSLRLDRTRDYARYLELLDAWGRLPGGTLSRATVERSIFSLTR